MDKNSLHFSSSFQQDADDNYRWLASLTPEQHLANATANIKRIYKDTLKTNPSLGTNLIITMTEKQQFKAMCKALGWSLKDVATITGNTYESTRALVSRPSLPRAFRLALAVWAHTQTPSQNPPNNTSAPPSKTLLKDLKPLTPPSKTLLKGF
jgi:hypothetical protein